MKHIKSISLMFPVYRDSKTVNTMIRKSIKVLKKTKKNFEIVIVDDGCPDNSGLVAQKFIKQNKRVKIIFHKTNMGYGAALRTGLKNCKNQWIFQVDGDDQYDVNDLPKLILASNTADLVITYRFKKNYNTLRIFISGVYNFLLRFMFGTKFKDISTGSRLIKRNLLKKIILTTNTPFLGAELAIRSYFRGFKVNEIGINTYPRNFGSGSSVGLKNIILTIKDMIILFIKIKILNVK